MNGKRVLKNTFYIIVGKSVQMALSLVITMVTARYLGPFNYGILNYAISVAAFVVPIALLGMNSVLVQELISYPNDESEILGTSLVMSVSSSILCIGGIALFVRMANRGEKDTFIVCILYSIMLIFQGLELIQYWFQSKLLSKYTSIAELIAYFAVSGYKIFLLVSRKKIYWFALSYSFDYAIIALLLYLVYRYKYKKRLRLSWNVGKRILKKSKYYIISTLMVTLFAQQDKVMIKLMVGNKATGYYSAAVTCATMSGFIFVAIIDSLRPVIFENKMKGKKAYEESITSVYSIIIYLCIIQGLLCTLFAKSIILTVYGKQYVPAIGVLQIIIWYSMFSYMGGIRDIWLLAENKQVYLIWINLCGAACNMILNYILIKLMGIYGAATASLLTQFFTNFLLTFIFKPIRHNNDFILQAANPKYAISLGIQIIRILKKTGNNR